MPLGSPRGILRVSQFPLGPIIKCLLFIYLNDLLMVPYVCSLEPYVDGSKLFLTFSITEVDLATEKLEQDLLRVAKWCCENNLLINPNKIKLLFLRIRQMTSKLPEDIQVSFLGASLRPAASPLDLHLTFNHHISNDSQSYENKYSNRRL